MVRMSATPELDEGDVVDEARLRKVRRYLEALVDVSEEDFTGRQLGFVEDIAERLDRMGPAATLSDREFGWLKGLWEQKC